MKLTIKFGEYRTSESGYVNNQSVNYLYLLKGQMNVQEKMSSDDLEDLDVVAAMNYTGTDKSIGYSNLSKTWNHSTVMKKEYWTEDGVEKSQTVYSLVDIDSSYMEVVDYNILNNRQYEYLITHEYVNSDENSTDVAQKKYRIKSKWNGWTLSELNPDMDDSRHYTVDPKNIWRFRYNISTGESSQQFTKTPQDTLSSFPVVSHGPKNSLVGSVTCLLGYEMLPSVIMNGKNTGGYTERPNEFVLDEEKTSNEMADMLDMWRDFCFSGNPKLLRDQKGNGYIVQITDSSNQTNENYNKIAETITFSWIKIGDVKNYMITEEG